MHKLGQSQYNKSQQASKYSFLIQRTFIKSKGKIFSGGVSFLSSYINIGLGIICTTAITLQTLFDSDKSDTIVCVQDTYKIITSNPVQTF